MIESLERHNFMAKVYNPFSDDFELLTTQAEIFFTGHNRKMESIEIESIATDAGAELIGFLSDSAVEDVETWIFENMGGEL